MTIDDSFVKELKKMFNEFNAEEQAALDRVGAGGPKDTIGTQQALQDASYARGLRNGMDFVIGMLGEVAGRDFWQEDDAKVAEFKQQLLEG